MKILPRIKEILLHPKTFFTEIRAERGLRTPLKFYAVISLFCLFLSYPAHWLVIAKPEIFPHKIVLYSTMKYGEFFSLFSEYSVLGKVILAFLPYLFWIGYSFLLAALVYGSGKILRGQVNYNDSYKLLAYSTTPFFILGWIPIWTHFGTIFMFYLIYRGASDLFQLNKAKSILLTIFLLIFFWGSNILSLAYVY